MLAETVLQLTSMPKSNDAIRPITYVSVAEPSPVKTSSTILLLTFTSADIAIMNPVKERSIIASKNERGIA